MGNSGKGKVLVVEDDRDIRTMLSIILRDDYELTLCPDGECGIRKASEEKPDIILLDVHMAGLSGLDVCRAVRRTPGITDTPIIILTAGTLKNEVSEGYAAGADDCILKPFDAADLMERMEKLITGSRD